MNRTHIQTALRIKYASQQQKQPKLKQTFYMKFHK